MTYRSDHPLHQYLNGAPGLTLGGWTGDTLGSTAYLRCGRRVAAGLVLRTYLIQVTRETSLHYSVQVTRYELNSMKVVPVREQLEWGALVWFLSLLIPQLEDAPG